jgi:hypothetical protein
MVVAGAWVFIATSSLLFSTQAVVTGSRAFTTVYRNTSGKTMLVHVGGTAAGNAHDVKAYSDNNAAPSTLVAEGGGATGRAGGVSFMVLNNNYYKVIAAGAPTLEIWTEWY